MQQCILVTDDDPIIRDVLARMIRQLGYEAQVASNGMEALQILSGPDSASIDVLLTDILMPRMSGIELLQAVHEMRPDLPVAMITGAATLDNSIAALNAGAYAYLLKPTRSDQLRTVITKGLTVRAQYRDQRAMLDRLQTQHKALEDQLSLMQESRATNQANDPLSELIRGLRHELGNAATAIKLNLSVLEEEGNDPELLRQHLKDLQDSTDELVSLVTRLKQYPRQASARDLVDLRQALVSLAEMTARDMEAHDVALDVVIPDQDIYVYGTDLELLRACNHILNNALEATVSAGGKQVQLATKLDAGVVTITISDEGPGFPEEMLDDPFSPGYTTKITDGVVRGLGLGLFIARATVTLYGGQIRLENRPEGGAEVHIRLPLAIVDMPPAQSTAAA